MATWLASPRILANCCATAADKPLLGCPVLAAGALALRSRFQFGHVARCLKLCDNAAAHLA
jgi:hypothetical protein